MLAKTKILVVVEGDDDGGDDGGDDGDDDGDADVDIDVDGKLNLNDPFVSTDRQRADQL